MLNVARRLCKCPLIRSLPSISTSSIRWAKKDPLCIIEAPKLENDLVMALPEEACHRWAQEIKICVPTKVDLIPISGIPYEHIKPRRVRIYQPTKNVMQSGTSNLDHWEMEFDNRQRWENPLIGWTSSGDPLSTMNLVFPTFEQAIDHCEKYGWIWFMDCSQPMRPFRPKSYAINFSWNRRTRVSTK